MSWALAEVLCVTRRRGHKNRRTQAYRKLTQVAPGDLIEIIKAEKGSGPGRRTRWQVALSIPADERPARAESVAMPHYMHYFVGGSTINGNSRQSPPGRRINRVYLPGASPPRSSLVRITAW